MVGGAAELMRPEAEARKMLQDDLAAIGQPGEHRGVL
jgi:hypothetical protein